jgi:hypothetical protein
MIDRESLRRINQQAEQLVDFVRGSNSYPLSPEDLDHTIFCTIYEQTEDGSITVEDADVLYGAFHRIYLQG